MRQNFDNFLEEVDKVTGWLDRDMEQIREEMVRAEKQKRFLKAVGELMDENEKLKEELKIKQAELDSLKKKLTEDEP